MSAEPSPPTEPYADPASNQAPDRPVKALFLVALCLVLTVVLVLRLYKLDTLQQEFYGDMDILQDYVLRILAGLWPLQFQLSAGPLYHYLIIPIVKVAGTDYAGLKFASVIVSLAGLAATYACARWLINDWFALLTTFIAGVSSWFLIFSRLGNSQIVLPLLTMLCLWWVMRIVQPGRTYDVIACAICAGLGLYVYPQSFVLPVVIFITLAILRWIGWPTPARWALWYGLVTLVLAVPFCLILLSDQGAYTTQSYLSDKFVTHSQPWLALASNAWKAALAFHVRGDQSYRSNANELPHLDWISGLLFIVGIVYWLVNHERRRWWPLWLVPLVLLQVPSILVLNEPQEVPSASRTLGVAPLVYLLVASGIWGLAKWLTWLQTRLHETAERFKSSLRKRIKPVVTTSVVFVPERLKSPLLHKQYLQYGLATLVTIGVLTGIIYLNIQRYFIDYINGLPNNNVSVGHLIGEYFDLLPLNTNVYIVGENWQIAGPGWFLEQEISQPRPINRLKPEEITCELLDTLPTPAVLVWNPANRLPSPGVTECAERLPGQLYAYRSKFIFRAASLLP